MEFTGRPEFDCCDPEFSEWSVHTMKFCEECQRNIVPTSATMAKVMPLLGKGYVLSRTSTIWKCGSCCDYTTVKANTAAYIESSAAYSHHHYSYSHVGRINRFSEQDLSAAQIEIALDEDDVIHCAATQRELHVENKKQITIRCTVPIDLFMEFYDSGGMTMQVHQIGICEPLPVRLPSMCRRVRIVKRITGYRNRQQYLMVYGDSVDDPNLCGYIDGLRRGLEHLPSNHQIESSYEFTGGRFLRKDGFSDDDTVRVMRFHKTNNNIDDRPYILKIGDDFRKRKKLTHKEEEIQLYMYADIEGACLTKKQIFIKSNTNVSCEFIFEPVDGINVKSIEIVNGAHCT